MIALALVALMVLLAGGVLAAKSGRRQLAIGAGLGVLFLGLIVALGAPSSDPGLEPLRPIDKNLKISEPASFPQVEQQARERNFSSFFSLRAPDRYQLRVDLNDQQPGLQIGFLGPEAAERFSVDNPVFDVLIANQIRNKKVYQQLAATNGKVINREGFRVFMPPRDAARRDVFFAVSKMVIATIVSPGQPVSETITELELIRPQ